MQPWQPLSAFCFVSSHLNYAWLFWDKDHLGLWGQTLGCRDFCSDFSVDAISQVFFLLKTLTFLVHRWQSLLFSNIMMSSFQKWLSLSSNNSWGRCGGGHLCSIVRKLLHCDSLAERPISFPGYRHTRGEDGPFQPRAIIFGVYSVESTVAR